eukprot:scaffold72822_cov26-Phaeocystis_antarctica.AAC.2
MVAPGFLCCSSISATEYFRGLPWRRRAASFARDLAATDLCRAVLGSSVGRAATAARSATNTEARRSITAGRGGLLYLASLAEEKGFEQTDRQTDRETHDLS